MTTTIAQLKAQVQPNMDSLSLWTRRQDWPKIATYLVLPTAGYLTARFLDGYHRWLELGAGGLPHDIRGYLVNLLLTATVAWKETKSLNFYERPEKNAAGWSKASEKEKMNARKSFLKGSLAERSGVKSKAIEFCAPQRERNEGVWVDGEVKEVSRFPITVLGVMLTRIRHISKPSTNSQQTTATPSNGNSPS